MAYKVYFFFGSFQFPQFELNPGFSKESIQNLNMNYECLYVDLPVPDLRKAQKLKTKQTLKANHICAIRPNNSKAMF